MTDITELAQRLAICAKEDTYPVLSPADCGALVEVLEKAQQERENWRTSFDNERLRADKLKAHIDEMTEERTASINELSRIIQREIKAKREAEQRIAELEDAEQKLCAANVTLDARADLAERQLAAMDSEPVVYIDKQWTLVYYVPPMSMGLKIGDKLYRHAQPAVDSDFIPKNLDKALGVLGMAIPESREEFNFQTERWIQRLIDRVIRYADEFQAAPACTCPSGDGSLRWPCPVHPGNSPAIPDTWIPVSERMPDSQEWVIVFAKWANQQVLCWDDVQNRWTDFEDQSYYADMFSHWMPLAAAPQEVQGE